jgi:hypothetical protein
MDHISPSLASHAHLGHDVAPILANVSVDREVTSCDDEFHGMDQNQAA